MRSLFQTLLTVVGVVAGLWMLILVAAWLLHAQEFGYDILRGLAPATSDIGTGFADLIDSFGPKFDFLYTWFNQLDPDGGNYYDPRYYWGPSTLILVVWLILTLLVVGLVSWIMSLLMRSLPSAAPSVSVGYGAVGHSGGGSALGGSALYVSLTVLTVFFVYEAHTLIDRHNDAADRERVGAPVASALERIDQDFVLSEKFPDCEVTSFETTHLGFLGQNCASLIQKHLIAGAAVSVLDGPFTEQVEIAYIRHFVEQAECCMPWLASHPDRRRAIEELGRWVREDYLPMRQQGYRDAASVLIGIMTTSDDRDSAQEARMDATYQLGIIFELLLLSDDPRSVDVAYRIAARTEQELGCVPSGLWQTGTGIATPVSSLPTCQEMALSASTADEGGSSLPGVIRTILVVALLGGGLTLGYFLRTNPTLLLVTYGGLIGCVAVVLLV